MHKRTYRPPDKRSESVQKSSLAIRSKVWFVTNDSHAFGAGLARLLDLVDRFGTLTHAAREARMSYRYAWNLIKEAEAHLGTSMILTQPGGTGGGHSALSAEGRRLLDTFKRLSSEVATFADQRFKTMFFHETASDLKDTP